MTFKAIFKCKACKQELTKEDVMYSNGVCPKCGNISNSTIVDHDKCAVVVADEPSNRGEAILLLLFTIFVIVLCYIFDPRG